jgi:hypothetical protein
MCLSRRVNVKKSSRVSNLQTEFHHVYLATNGAPALSIPVKFADQASKVFCAYREKYQFGASEMEAGCGNIYNSLGVLVGHISYNGRIWDASGNLVE